MHDYSGRRLCTSGLAANVVRHKADTADSRRGRGWPAARPKRDRRYREAKRHTRPNGRKTFQPRCVDTTARAPHGSVVDEVLRLGLHEGLVRWQGRVRWQAPGEKRQENKGAQGSLAVRSRFRRYVHLRFRGSHKTNGEHAINAATRATTLQMHLRLGADAEAARATDACDVGESGPRAGAEARVSRAERGFDAKPVSAFKKGTKRSQLPREGGESRTRGRRPAPRARRAQNVGERPETVINRYILVTSSRCAHSACG